jgi:cell division protein ZapA
VIVAQLDVKILDRDYRLSVSDDDRPRLLQAVEMVDERMRAVRDAGKISGHDRIAVMAALQIAHDLLAAPGSANANSESSRKLRKVSDELDAEVKRQEKLF